MTRKRESKIVYLEGDNIRSIRGEIIGDDGFFIKIFRESGSIQISKNYIIKIEQNGGE